MATVSANTSENSTNETDINLSELNDDIIMYTVSYLDFVDIIHSFLMLNKRFSELHLNPHLLYSIKDFPIHKTKCYDLMMKYCSHLIKTNKTDTFIYRYIKKINFMNCGESDLEMNFMFNTDDGMDQDHDLNDLIKQYRECVALLFRNLYSLKCLKIYSFFESLKELPIQSNLISLSFNSNKIDPFEIYTIYSFFKSKINMDSLYLLKQLRISELLITANLLNIFSRMKNLEIFEFDAIYFDETEVENGIINKQLIEKTFLSWKNVKKLDIFQDTFFDGYLYDIILRILLSFNSLNSLKLTISPFHDQRYDENASINRILPFFKGFTCLNELYLSIKEENLLFTLEILKMVKKSECIPLSKIDLDLIGVDEDLNYLSVYKNLMSFKNLIFKCLTMINDEFAIDLPGNYKDELIHFNYFVEWMNEINDDHKININKLVIKVCCFEMLFDIIPRFLKMAKLLIKSSRKIGCKSIKIKYIYGLDWKYSLEEWSDIRKRMKNIGFILDIHHPDLTRDAFFIYYHVD